MQNRISGRAVVQNGSQKTRELPASGKSEIKKQKNREEVKETSKAHSTLDARANSNTNPLMLLAYRVNTPIHAHRFPFACVARARPVWMRPNSLEVLCGLFHDESLSACMGLTKLRVDLLVSIYSYSAASDLARFDTCSENT